MLLFFMLYSHIIILILNVHVTKEERVSVKLLKTMS